MRGDFTRDTRERSTRMGTRAVLLQQGRPILDSDVNEEAGLVAERSEAIVRHVVGLRGAPRDDAGFAIVSTGAGFTIGSGAIYAQGLPVRNNAAVAYDQQFPVGILPALTDVIPDGQEGLVYLEALLRPALDPELTEPALDGVDTAVREIVGWAVRVAPLAGIGMSRAALIEALDRNRAVDIVPWRGTTGGLDADVDTQPTDAGPCEIAPTAGYLDQLNRLYRVEIHAGGGPGAATFKWTEDASREAGLRPSGAGFTIDLPKARVAEWFPKGTFVEIIGDDRARAGVPGPIGAIDSDPGAALAVAGVAASELSATARIRRWAEAPKPVPTAGNWAPLSKGVRVRFSAGNYVPGSAWTIPARTVLGDIAWPPYRPADLTQAVSGSNVDFYAPSEGRRRYAALAIVARNAGAFTVAADLRDLFPPLTDLTADAVRFNDDAAGLGADNVQEAIDALTRRHGECCTWHARPSSDLQALVNAIPARANGTLCLAVGNYELAQPLRIAGKGRIRITGEGPGTKLWCRVSTQALVIEDCLSADIADILVAAESHAPPANLGHTSGAIEISGTGPVRVLRSTVIAQGRRWKQASAIRIACSTKEGGGDVTIADCDVVAGDLASGILITDARTLRVVDNRIRPRLEPPAVTLSRWAQDKAIAAAVGRIAFSHAIDQPAGARPAMPIRRDSKLFAEHRVNFGGAINLSFFSHKLVKPEAWRMLSERLRAEMPGADSRRFRLRMRHLASTILPHRGQKRIANHDFGGFAAFYAFAESVIVATLDTGIVVGGARARDVTIAGNRIEGAFHGIRVGIGAGVPRERRMMGTIRVQRNLVRLRVVPADIARVGIYVGNAERSWVSENDIAIELADPEFENARANLLRQQSLQRLHCEGVRIVGVLGPVLHLRENSVAGCIAGYTVTSTPGTDASRKLWLVEGNYSVGASAPYRLDALCKASDNV